MIAWFCLSNFFFCLPPPPHNVSLHPYMHISSLLFHAKAPHNCTFVLFCFTDPSTPGNRQTLGLKLVFRWHHTIPWTMQTNDSGTDTLIHCKIQTLSCHWQDQHNVTSITMCIIIAWVGHASCCFATKMLFPAIPFLSCLHHSV